MAKDRSSGPQWTNEPSDMEAAPNLDLWRVPTTGEIRATIISHRIVGTATHYYGGSTKPCTGDECKACLEGLQPREYFWCVCLHRTSGAMFILELTGRAAEPLARAFQARRTIRGLIISVKRTNKKSNGPQKLTIEGQLTERDEMPRAPNVMMALHKIWKLPGDPRKIYADQVRAARATTNEEEPTNGIRGEVRTLGTDGMELPRRRGRHDDVHVDPQATSGLREEPAPSTSEPNPKTHAQQILDRFTAMAEPQPNGKGSV